jgi:hypothetical protein
VTCQEGAGPEGRALAPHAPTNLQASAISADEISLQWSDNSDNEEGFEVERGTATAAYVSVGAVVANISSFHDVGLSPAEMYTYRVRASNKEGVSPFTAPASARTFLVTGTDSPVEGLLRVTGPENLDCVNVELLWTFCQHRTGYHRRDGGLAGSDDTFAWDANLLGDADKQQPVFPVAPGRVVRYAGLHGPGEVSGAVLVEHSTSGRTWWTGYLHMSGVGVILGQDVSTSTVLGYVSNVSSTEGVPNHLHLAVYDGANEPGGLSSRNLELSARVLLSESIVWTPGLGARPPSNLFIVPTSPAGTDRLIGRIRTQTGYEPAITDVARSRSGKVWAISYDSLYRLDVGNAAASSVGKLAVPGAVALEFDQGGRLLGAGTGGNFFVVDTATGHATILGAFGRGLIPQGDLALARDGRLYATAYTPSGLSVLVTVDPTSGTAVEVQAGVEIGYENVWGLKFVGETLFGLTSDLASGEGSLIRIDHVAGTGVLVRGLSFSAGGGGVSSNSLAR